jgi:hypothetical protein
MAKAALSDMYWNWNASESDVKNFGEYNDLYEKAVKTKDPKHLLALYRLAEKNGDSLMKDAAIESLAKMATDNIDSSLKKATEAIEKRKEAEYLRMDEPESSDVLHYYRLGEAMRDEEAKHHGIGLLANMATRQTDAAARRIMSKLERQKAKKHSLRIGGKSKRKCVKKRKNTLKSRRFKQK